MNPSQHPCCAPDLPSGNSAARSAVIDVDTARDIARQSLSLEFAELPGGSFDMGDSWGEGYRADGEHPVHQVIVAPFAIATTTVTNAQYAAFVDATGYRTQAEHFGSSAVFHLAVRARSRDVAGPVGGTGWWLEVRGADWAHPAGRKSRWQEIADHPVTHVSWHDANAFCRWSGMRLPTEAEWQYAARGGHERRRFPWGDALEPGGEIRCNIWHGSFPTHPTLEDGHLTTAAARAFLPNDFGLYQTAGNVWEWCADWFSAAYYRHSPKRHPAGPPRGERRVMRGGSYLCHDSYCHRYRVAARSSNAPDSSSGNLGFRTVRAAA